ncbi:MAG TPA: hypothetical protein VGM44_00395, partial [Polyangiaceae bacterium]
MGRAWVSALGACLLFLACGGGSHADAPGSGGGSAGTATTSGGSSSGGSAGSSGATSGAGGQPAAPIAAADLCPIFTADLCVYLMQCDGARYRDAAQCQAELDCYGLPQLLDANAKGIIDYNP